MAQVVMRAMGAAEAPLAGLPLTSCGTARFLIGHRPVPVRGPQLGDPLSKATRENEATVRK